MFFSSSPVNDQFGFLAFTAAFGEQVGVSPSPCGTHRGWGCSGGLWGARGGALSWCWPMGARPGNRFCLTGNRSGLSGGIPRRLIVLQGSALTIVAALKPHGCSGIV